MDPRETGRRYDAIASMWDSRRLESMHGVRFLEKAIALCQSRGTALDVGCGSGGRMIDKLLVAGFRVTGVDVSPAMLEIAKARHPTVAFLNDDITEWVPQSQFDLILAWDSIFHLPHRSHAVVLGKLCACLADQGVLLFTAGGIDAEIVGNMHGVEFAYSSLSEIALMKLVQRGGCIPVLVERDQYPLHHLVFLAVKAKPIAA